MMIIPGEVNMARSKLVISNKNQTVRLPKSVAFPDSVTQVEIVKLGNGRLISPLDASWDVFFDGPKVGGDFMIRREQPKI